MIHMSAHVGRPGPHVALTRQIIACAIEVHRELGPGLLESAYQRCLSHELGLQGLLARNEVGIPISYKGLDLDNSYRADLIVEDAVMLELKAVDLILPVHEAQLLTYLKHSHLHIGLLINFNVRQLTNGIRRFVRN